MVYKDMDIPAMDPDELVMTYWNRCVASNSFVPQDLEVLETFYNNILRDMSKFLPVREIPDRNILKNQQQYGFITDKYLEVVKSVADDYLDKMPAEQTTTYNSWRERGVTECNINPTATKKAGHPVYRPTHIVSILDKSSNTYFDTNMIRINKYKMMEVLELTKSAEVMVVINNQKGGLAQLNDYPDLKKENKEEIPKPSLRTLPFAKR
jgi:hypothetical protein